MNAAGGGNNAAAPILDLVKYANDLSRVYYIAELLYQRTTAAASAPTVESTTAAGAAANSIALPGTLTPLAVLSGATAVGAQQPAEGMDSVQIRELCQVVARMTTNAYYLAGARYLQEKNLALAAEYLRKSLLVYIPEYTASRVRNFSAESVNDDFAASVFAGSSKMSKKLVTSVGVSAPFADLRTVMLTAETCLSLHW